MIKFSPFLLVCQHNLWVTTQVLSERSRVHYCAEHAAVHDAVHAAAHAAPMLEITKDKDNQR